MTARGFPSLALLVVAVAFCGCPSGRVRRGPDPCLPEVSAGEGCRPWYAGTEDDRRRIEESVKRLATARGEELLDLGRAILARGEAATPYLVDALKGPSDQARGQAAYLLGVRKDRRTIPALRAAAADPVPPVRYEAAAALLELSDPAGLDVLVDGLADSDARLRAKCIAVLAEKTGQRFGFEADGRPDDRDAAIARWRTWLASRAPR
jgi:HEAT repeat protein